jgi:hypothetical protein
VNEVLQQRPAARSWQWTGARTSGVSRTVAGLVLALAIIVGVTAGWVASTVLFAPSQPSVQDIHAQRAEAMGGYHESLWRTRLERIHDARARGMVEYHERLWRAQQMRGSE